MTKKNDTALIRRGNNALTRQAELREEYITPAVDVFETGDSFIVRIDMPGALRDTLQVSVDSRALVVKGRAGLPHAEGAQLLYKEIAKKKLPQKVSVDGRTRIRPH
ncbi:MAG: Hsp20/alpha crystallin family protein [Ignavibacteriales bacterium]|nr:Hsp20/alpha crystallin family protein [Ignavibacteriales bacterium]